MINKLAFCGCSGCGKNYLAEYLVGAHGFKQLALGSIVKKIANKLYPKLKLDYPHGRKDNKIIYTNKNTGINWTPRDIWVWMNNLKVIDPDIFLNEFIKLHGKELKNPKKKIVITDLRFTEACDEFYATPELEYLQSTGFKVVYIESNTCHKVKDRDVAESSYEILKEEADYKFYNKKDEYVSWRKFLHNNKIITGDKQDETAIQADCTTHEYCNFGGYF